MLALITGVLALAAGLLRLGFLANFISEPVLKGFIIGLALTIMIGQLPKLFGIEKGEGNFFEQAWHFLANIGDTQWRTLAVGAGSLVLVLVLREVAPKVPGSLVAVILGVLVVQLFDLDAKGVDIVGDIDAGLPSIGLPDGVGFSDYLTTAGAAVGVMLVGFAESLGAGKTYASKFHYDIDANRELIGLGAANIGSGLSSGMVVNGSLSKTAVNGSAGARTQLSGLVCAALTVITLLFLTGLFEELPEATLGRGRDRRADRARRLPRPGRAVPPLHPPPRAHLRPRGPTGLHRRHGGDVRRAGVRHPARAVHRHRACRCCSCSTGRRSRTSPSSARSPAPPVSTGTGIATRRTRRHRASS